MGKPCQEWVHCVTCVSTWLHRRLHMLVKQNLRDVKTLSSRHDAFKRCIVNSLAERNIMTGQLQRSHMIDYSSHIKQDVYVLKIHVMHTLIWLLQQNQKGQSMSLEALTCHVMHTVKSSWLQGDTSDRLRETSQLSWIMVKSRWCVTHTTFYLFK